jgi:hypothetical protein
MEFLFSHAAGFLSRKGSSMESPGRRPVGLARGAGPGLWRVAVLGDEPPMVWRPIIDVLPCNRRSGRPRCHSRPDGHAFCCPSQYNPRRRSGIQLHEPCTCYDGYVNVIGESAFSMRWQSPDVDGLFLCVNVFILFYQWQAWHCVNEKKVVYAEPGRCGIANTINSGRRVVYCVNKIK